MSQFLSHSPEETEDFGFRLAQQLKGGEVIAMYGGMGMGKTAFTRGLVIEWSEHIEEALPKDCIKIQIALGAHENERIFTVEGGNL